MWQMYGVVILGGALGSALRFWLFTFITDRSASVLPLGTIVVNVSGCFVIGLFSALTEPNGAYPASPLVRLFVMIGILGGFTTFSSFSLQTLALLNKGDGLNAGLNVLLSVTLCLFATWLGHYLAVSFSQR